MVNEEKAKEIAEKSQDYFYHDEKECGLACALRMAEWKDKQFYEEQNVLLNLLKLLIAAGGDTKIIEQLIDTLDNQTIIEDLKALLQ